MLIKFIACYVLGWTLAATAIASPVCLVGCDREQDRETAATSVPKVTTVTRGGPQNSEIVAGGKPNTEV